MSIVIKNKVKDSVLRLSTPIPVVQLQNQEIKIKKPSTGGVGHHVKEASDICQLSDRVANKQVTFTFFILQEEVEYNSSNDSKVSFLVHKAKYYGIAAAVKGIMNQAQATSLSFYHTHSAPYRAFTSLITSQACSVCFFPYPTSCREGSLHIPATQVCSPTPLIVPVDWNQVVLHGPPPIQIKSKTGNLEDILISLISDLCSL